MKTEQIIHFFCPQKCPCCRELLPFNAEADRLPFVCDTCSCELDREKRGLCPVCGQSFAECECIPDEMKRSGCAALLRLFPYESVRSHAADSLVLYMKDYTDKRVLSYVAGMLKSRTGKYFSEHGMTYDGVAVTYVPRSRKTMNRTGHDQARELAVHFAEGTDGLEFMRLISRKSNGKPQKKLSGRERIANARNTYFPYDEYTELNGKTVILIDDVVTTGASMASCVGILKGMGANTVVCVAVAVSNKTENHN